MNPINPFNDTIGIIIAWIDICMYFFVQPMALIGYIIFLVAICKSNNVHNLKKNLIISNKILWWISLGPCITLLLAIALTNIFLQDDLSAAFIPFVATWLYISLFCIIGFLVKLFYQQKNKTIPMKWYQLGILWYGINFAGNLALWCTAFFRSK